MTVYVSFDDDFAKQISRLLRNYEGKNENDIECTYLQTIIDNYIIKCVNNNKPIVKVYKERDFNGFM